MRDITAETVKAQGYEFEELDPNIFLVKDFITEEERQWFIDLAESKTEQEWLGDYLEGVKDRVEARYGDRDPEAHNVEITHNWNDKVIYINNNEKVSTLSQRLEKLFRHDTGYTFRSFGIIQRQYPGSELKGHYDQYVDNKMVWASVLYLNDDYKDGEVFFLNQGIALQPPKGSLLVFPSTEEYWHGVKHVGPGPTRYVMPSFIWTDKDAY